MINYLEIVKHSKGNEQLMWESVAHINDFVMAAYEAHPEEVSKFLKEQYELLNGHHFNEWLAKKVVSEMWHEAADGKSEVVGELISVTDAASGIMANWPADKQAKYRWDAYVAANTYAHDLANTNLAIPMLMALTREFWFEDDDFTDGNKIYWYHSNKKGIWK